MEKYKRLTRYGKLTQEYYTGGGFVNVDLITKRLGEIEDKIAAGTLVELPCKFYRQCPNCENEDITPQDKYCKICGTKLEAWEEGE